MDVIQYRRARGQVMPCRAAPVYERVRKFNKSFGTWFYTRGKAQSGADVLPARGKSVDQPAGEDCCDLKFTIWLYKSHLGIKRFTKEVQRICILLKKILG